MKRSTEIKKLDAALSKLVRLGFADDNGYVQCFTCGQMKNWKYEMQCGHFQSRSKYSTRWLFDPDNGMVNVMPQCKRCNMSNGGQQYIFGRRLDAVYGEGTADKIVALGNTPVKYSNDEIVELREGIEKLLKEHMDKG